MKYRAYIQPPRAQRLKNREVYIEISEGFDGHIYKRTLNPSNAKFIENMIEFEVDDDIDKYLSQCMDGYVFKLYVEYSNNTSTRKEKVCLVPEVINEVCEKD